MGKGGGGGCGIFYVLVRAISGVILLVMLVLQVAGIINSGFGGDIMSWAQTIGFLILTIIGLVSVVMEHFLFGLLFVLLAIIIGGLTGMLFSTSGLIIVLMIIYVIMMWMSGKQDMGMPKC